MRENVARRTTNLRRISGEEAAQHRDIELWVRRQVSEIINSSLRPEFKPGMVYQLRIELSEWDPDAAFD